MINILDSKKKILASNIFLKGVKHMRNIKLNKIIILSTLLFVCSSFLCATNSYALFEDLAKHGGDIFLGMREIIYAVSGFGIIAVVIGAIFGNINYKWLTAIVIGLFVIAGAASLINYMVGDKVTVGYITDTLKTGGASSKDVVSTPSSTEK